MIVLSQAPLLLDPSLFQFFVHNESIDASYKSSIVECHLLLSVVHKSWLEKGPSRKLDGFCAHFAFYLDIDDVNSTVSYSVSVY